jgi:hypothetical protein
MITPDPTDIFFAKEWESGCTHAQDLELKYILENLSVHSVYLHADANLCVAGIVFGSHANKGGWVSDRCYHKLFAKLNCFV